jgi:hypothetical protein
MARCSTVRDATVDDWKSRVRIARMEAEDFRQKIALLFFVAAGFWAAVMAAALWWLALPAPWLIICGAAATILSVGALIAEASQRLFTQNAYTEMTIAHLETEIERLHDRIGGLEVDVGKTIGENRSYCL